VVSSALRYRAQAPIVDQLLREIGLDAKDLTRAAAAALPAAVPAATTSAATAAAERKDGTSSE
jgi:hypothetical protein